MENFSKEIVTTIVEDYSDDKQLIADMLLYLYKTTVDDNMKLKILEVFNSIHRCIECGDKMTPYLWINENNDYETTYDCLACNNREVE